MLKQIESEHKFDKGKLNIYTRTFWCAHEELHAKQARNVYKGTSVQVKIYVKMNICKHEVSIFTTGQLPRMLHELSFQHFSCSFECLKRLSVLLVSKIFNIQIHLKMCQSNNKMQNQLFKKFV